MEQATSGSEYRAKRRKLITLSSGDKFLLKKPGKTALVELMDIFDTKIDADRITDLDYEIMIEKSKENQLSSEQLARLIDVLFTHCVLSPKIVFELTDNDNEIWIEEIDPIDTINLLTQLFEWIDLSPERIKETFFRGGQSIGKDNRFDGDKLENQAVEAPEGS